MSIIFSALALEAFINELLAIAKLAKQDGYDEDFIEELINAIDENDIGNISGNQKLKPLIRKINCLLNRFKLEVRYIPQKKSTREKFMLASEALGNKFDKGKKPYQDFADLFKLRDCLVHLKPEDLIESNEDKLFQYFGRKLTRSLRSKKIFQQHTSVESITLLISTAKAAEWACRTASQMVNELLNQIPESTVKTGYREILNSYKGDFQF